MRFLSKSLLLGAAIALASAGSWASYACFMRAPQPVQVWMDDIEVEITNQVAVKRYKCVFLNPNANAVVGGMCYMEVEPGAQVDEMSLQIGDKKVKGEVLDIKKANQVFTDIVRQGGSPALLEYYGNKLIRTRVPRVPPRGTVTVYLQYTTVLKAKDDLVRIRVLNTNPKAKLQPLKKASVTVKIKSDAAVLNVYSPTHDVKVSEAVGEDALVVKWEQANYLPKTPFVLYYATSKKQKIGVNLLAHREEAERGYFMTMIAPAVGGGKANAKAISEDDIQSKDVVFCVDTSFSMNENGKMDQARKGLEYCVKNLRKGDRFNIVDFSTEARTFRKTMVDVDETTRKQALNYIGDLEASGGTAIHEALETSLEQFGDDKRLKMIMFMTDGLPTIGEREPQKILSDIGGKNAKNVRMFVFGEGYDVNTRLLDALASDNRGDSDYIMPKEDIASRISSFFDKVGSPIMTDLEVSIEGVKRSDIYPRVMPDLFKGDQVIVYGRYDISGEKKVSLSGMVNGERRTLEYTVNFPATHEGNDFVPRLWAGQKVSNLLSALRKKGQNDEMVQEVVGLAKRFGIVTPYTAYLVHDETYRMPATRAGKGGAWGGRGAGRLRKKLKESKKQSDDRDAPKPARAEMAQDAAALGFSRRAAASGKLNKLDGSGGESEEGGKKVMSKMRYIGARTFYRSGDFWYESAYTKADKATDIAVGSDEYFAFLAKHKGVSKYLALGQVVVKLKGSWYRITPRK